MFLANKYKGEVAFEAAGENYVLRFSANAIVGIEEAFDKTIKQLGEMMSDPETLRMSTVKKIFAVGLVDHYAESRPEIDENTASKLFASLSPIEATAIVSRAFTAAFDLDGGQAAPSQNPPGTGAATTERCTAGTGQAS